MSDGFEANLTLFLPAQTVALETAFFSVWSEDGRTGIELSLLPTLRARLSALVDGAVYVETTSTAALPVDSVFVLALVVAGGVNSTKARIHVDDVVAAKVRQDKPATPVLSALDSYVVKLNRGASDAAGIRMGIVEFVVASRELPAVDRLAALQYYRENARRVGHLTWFEPDGHGWQHAGARTLKLAPGVQAVPIPASAVRSRA